MNRFNLDLDVIQKTFDETRNERRHQEIIKSSKTSNRVAIIAVILLFISTAVSVLTYFNAERTKLEVETQVSKLREELESTKASISTFLQKEDLRNSGE